MIMRRVANVVGIVSVIAVLLGAYSSPVSASADAGIEIEFGKFRLNVYYSVALDYDEGADEFIRDPQLALFALMVLLQANSEQFAAIDHQVEVELYKRSDTVGNFLSVIEDPQKNRNIIRDGVVHGEISEEIVRVICNKYADACKQSPLSKVVLYRCQTESCPGQVSFGSFPSVYGVNKSWAILPPTSGAEGIKATKRDIGKYFEKLE